MIDEALMLIGNGKLFYEGKNIVGYDNNGNLILAIVDGKLLVKDQLNNFNTQQLRQTTKSLCQKITR